MSTRTMLIRCISCCCVLGTTDDCGTCEAERRAVVQNLSKKRLGPIG